MKEHVKTNIKNDAVAGTGAETMSSDQVSVDGGGASETSGDTGNTPSTQPDGSRHYRDDESINIAREENTVVLVWRWFVLLFLFVCTVGVAVAVYYYVDNSEREEFQAQFDNVSSKTLEALGNSLDLKLGAMDALAVTLVSYAKSWNDNWPFISLVDHAVRVSKLRSIMHAISIEQYHVVSHEQRSKWEEYAVLHEGWVKEAITVQSNDDMFLGQHVDIGTVESHISTIKFDGGLPVGQNYSRYAPSWQKYPVVLGRIPYNWDALQHPKLGAAISSAIEEQKVVISRVLNLLDPNDPVSPGSVDSTNFWASTHVSSDTNPGEPLVQFLYPILDTAVSSVYGKDGNNSAEVVAIIASSFYWSSFLKDILPAGENGLVVVFENACNQSFTYQITGPDTVYLGQGDLHDPKYSNLGMEISSALNDLSDYNTGQSVYSGVPMNPNFCEYTVTAYPSSTMEAISRTASPIIYTVAAVVIFAFTSFVFLLYDNVVAIRQRKVMKAAVQSTAIVSSLFPASVRDRLYQDSVEGKDIGPDAPFQPTKLRLKTFLKDGTSTSNPLSSTLPELGTKPIADHFSDCTVMFADIANFTAWSSEREPGQVFLLLETVYGAFDKIAERRGVFKVETIGDSYVAVTGLPEPRDDHALIMAKFARDCRERFELLCKHLEETLGPETGELKLRIGLNSGSVTAGVLRGAKTRFQIFGDTVNTAARMESTGLASRIQASQSTVDLIVKFGKSHWIQLRDKKIEAKGKGLLQTYWVEPRSNPTDDGTSQEGATPSESPIRTSLGTNDDKTDRLVNWNVEVLAKLLRKVIARRKLHQNNVVDAPMASWERQSHRIVMNEVQQIIELPSFDPSIQQVEENLHKVVIEPNVMAQLRDFVCAISQTYHNNSFHNFEHASHVCMSVAKLMSRIVAPDKEFVSEHELHDHTYGITSDPLTQFACVFAALIHDADHQGVSNAQLVKEESEMAKIYNKQSVAEQNSVNVAWTIFVSTKYAALRAALCKSKDEEIRFRQLVVNSVMATDLLDKDLKKLRDLRWEKAFCQQCLEEDDRTSINRKATVVIEHLIQASDVAHTMQHWHIYCKWNERLFMEMSKAFQDGRAEKNPAEFWYEGELGFFDFYIIPLTKKLSECGVFGVSSDEYYAYACENRREWEKKGKQAVAEMVDKWNQHHQNSNLVLGLTPV